jgi:hypothetical protein
LSKSKGCSGTSMSVVTGDTGTELMAIGGAAATVGASIASYGSTLPDSTPGSARDIAVSVGMAIAAVGGALVSIGAFLHSRYHKTVQPPVVQSKV